MIAVTGLGGGVMVVNVDLIITIEQTPDTVITLVNGDKLIVRESLEQLIERTIAYRQRGVGIRLHETPPPKPSKEDDHAA